MNNRKKPYKKSGQNVKEFEYDKRKLQFFIEIFDNILSSVRESLMVLDSDLQVIKANHSFYKSPSL